jgi:hypothetical protein
MTGFTSHFENHFPIARRRADGARRAAFTAGQLPAPASGFAGGGEGGFGLLLPSERNSGRGLAAIAVPQRGQRLLFL